MSNPWKMNLGKLVMPNVFFNAELIKVLAKMLNPKTWKNHLHDGSLFFPITREYISTIFQLDLSMNLPLRIRDLLEEYHTMDTSYKRWSLPLHRP